MKAISNKINYFTVIDNTGKIEGNYYLDQCGNVVSFPKQMQPTPIHLPYAVSINVDNMDDVCTLHVSEIEDMISKLNANMNNVTDHDLRMKYTGYIEALNYIVSHNSYIDPWSCFIHSLEEE